MNKLFALAVVLLCGFATPIWAQDTITVPPANVSSPRDTMETFIEATNQLFKAVQRRQYFKLDSPLQARLHDKVLECLDLSEVPAYAREQFGEEAAVCIKEILDRAK